jgi:hypothetical protein
VVSTLERADREGGLSTPSRMLLARLYAETGEDAKAIASRSGGRSERIFLGEE